MRTLISILFLLGASTLYSQVIWTEDFSAGSAARGTSAVGYPGSSGGTWGQTITGAEGASANQWYVSGEECGNAAGTCGSGCTNGDASLHVSAIGGLCGTPDCGAAYDETFAANATDRRVESPLINTTGYASLTLDFGYIAAQGDDSFRVEYSCDGGSTWNILSTPAATQCCSCLDAFICGFIGICCPPQTQQVCTGGEQGYWTTFSMALPACTENIANLRIGFHWANDGNGIGTDPSVAIDDISITSAMPLPVELVNVKASDTRSGNLIEWTTLSETNNSHFEIQHHDGDGIFKTIGTMPGQGTTTSPTDYQWMHENVAQGDNYYRLKQVDFDGAVEFSQTLMVRKTVSEERKLLLYPNPANHKITAQYLSGKSDEANFMILDMSGRIVLEKKTQLTKGDSSYTLSISELDNGPYLFVVLENGERTVQSFSKQ